jgi:hypothetical protein
MIQVFLDCSGGHIAEEPRNIMPGAFTLCPEHGRIVRVNHTVTRPGDLAFALLLDDFTTTPVRGLYRESCYICRDPEFAQMGLPLCRPCPECQRAGRGLGHIAADDDRCDGCGHEDGPEDPRKDLQ